MKTTNQDNALSLEIREITAAETHPLRLAVLWPGAPERIRVPDDEIGHHFGAFQGRSEEPVSIVSLFIDKMPDGAPIDIESGGSIPSNEILTARFRKFATALEYQRKGIGGKLLDYVFSYAQKELGATSIWCSARTASLPWYAKRGMEAVGTTWMKGGHEYVKMKKEFR